MAVSVPERDDDQVKAAGSKFEKTVEVRENLDGGPNKADHRAATGAGRINDHGISKADYVNMSPQRLLRGGSLRGLAGVTFNKKIGGPFEDRQGFLADNLAGQIQSPLVASLVTTPSTGPLGGFAVVTADASASIASVINGVSGAPLTFLWTAFLGIIISGTTTTPIITIIGPSVPISPIFTVVVTDSFGATDIVTVDLS